MMNRITRGLILILGLPLAGQYLSAGEIPSDRPNIVIIYADDMGYGDLAIQNPESKIPTPHLDKLAMQGTRFTDAHSSSGICTPSRYALLTGRYHWRKLHGIVGKFGASVFSPDRVTLPELLREHGYRTACIGKWHLGWDWESIRRPGAVADSETGYAPDAFNWELPIPDGPLAHGFDYYFGDDVPNFPPYAWIENDRILEAPTVPFEPISGVAEHWHDSRPGPMVAGWRQDAVMPELTRRAVEWVRQQKDHDSPFLLYFALTSPHTPIVPARDFIGSSSAGGYGDFVAESDWAAGEVLQALVESGLRENTIVIFSSDNGPEHIAYERIRNYSHRSMGPLRGVKRDLWEGGHRVPFIVSWPGKVPAGRVSPSLMSQIDIMATLAALAGITLPDGAAEDSIDQSPEWTGRASGQAIRQSLVHNTHRKGYAIREGDWLLVNAPTGQVSQVPEWYQEHLPEPGDTTQVLLYNLKDDLGQRDNLAPLHPDRVEQMRALLRSIQQAGDMAGPDSL